MSESDLYFKLKKKKKEEKKKEKKRNRKQAPSYFLDAHKSQQLPPVDTLEASAAPLTGLKNADIILWRQVVVLLRYAFMPGLTLEAPFTSRVRFGGFRVRQKNSVSYKMAGGVDSGWARFGRRAGGLRGCLLHRAVARGQQTSFFFFFSFFHLDRGVLTADSRHIGHTGVTPNRG